MPASFQFKRLSLRRRIVLLLVLGMFVVLGVMGVSSFLSVRQTIDRSLQERLLLAQNVAGHLDYIIRQSLIRLQDVSFAQGVDLQDNRLEPEKLALHNAYLNSIFTDGVFLLDERGIVVWREPYRPGFMGEDFSHYPHVKETLTSGKPVVSNLYSLPHSGKKVVTALVPIKGWESYVLGMVGGDIDPTNSRLQEVLKVVKMGKTGYIDLVDEHGVVLASTRLNRVLEESDHRHYLANLIGEKKSSVRTCHRCHEQEQIKKRETEVIAFAPLAEVSWGVSIRQTEREVLAPAKAMARRFLLFSVPLIAIVVVLARKTAQSIISPIGTLTDAAQSISQGDLGKAIPFMGEDEIGRLGQSFDLMRAKLKDSLDQIQRWNRELEEKVHQRTRELEELGQELLRRNRELSLLNSIAMVVTGTLDLEETLRYSFDRLLELAAAEAGAIFLWEREPPVLRSAIFRGVSEETTRRIGQLIQEGLLPDSTEASRQQGKSGALMRDAQLDSRELVGESLRSCLYVPLISKGKALGSVWLATRGDRDFTAEDASLLSSIGGQIAVAIENAALYQEVQRKEALRGEILRKVISAQEEERKRIARELHDETSQALVALMMAMERAMVESGGDNNKKRLEPMRELVVNTLDGVHRLIYDLRPSLLDDLGLRSAIRWYAESHLEPLGINFAFYVSGRELRLPGQMETVLFRVIQETLTNIIRHAGAESVEIRLDFREKAVSLTIEDNGKGFDVEATTSAQGQKDSGLGLMGMKERVSLLEGTLQICSSPGLGTRIVIEVPYSRAEVAGG